MKGNIVYFFSPLLRFFDESNVSGIFSTTTFVTLPVLSDSNPPNLE